MALIKAIIMILRKLAFGWSDCNVKNEFEWNDQLFSNIQGWCVRHWLIKTNCILDPLIFQVEQHYNKLCKVFFRLTKTPKCMCGAMDGTHIKLANKPKCSYQTTDYLFESPADCGSISSYVIISLLDGKLARWPSASCCPPPK